MATGFVDWSEDDAQQAASAARAISGSAWYKFRQGKNEIRILPVADASWGMSYPIYTTAEHLIDVKKFPVPGQEKTFGFLCPKVERGEHCPLCELEAQLRASGSKADLELAEAIKVKPKYYANIVDMYEPELGVQQVSFSPGVYGKIEALRGMKNINFSHPLKGCSIIIQKTGEGMNTRYPLVTDGKQGELEGWQDYLAQAKNLREFPRQLGDELFTQLDLACIQFQPSPKAKLGGNSSATRQLGSRTATRTAQDEIDDGEY